MSSTDLKLIDEFLNFKDFSNGKKGQKNQEIGPWGTPLGNQDIFCYRKRLEETSALTNKSAKRQMKNDNASPQQYNEGCSQIDDESIQDILLADPCNKSSSNAISKKDKHHPSLTFQMSQTSQKSDFLEENIKLYQSADMQAPLQLKQDRNKIRVKHSSVGRGVTDTSRFMLQTQESDFIRYENELDQIKQVLKEQNDSQRIIDIQNHTRDTNFKQMEAYNSSLALMPENIPAKASLKSIIHSNLNNQQILSTRNKYNFLEQKRINNSDNNGNNNDIRVNNHNNDKRNNNNNFRVKNSDEDIEQDQQKQQYYVRIEHQQTSPQKRITHNMSGLKDQKTKKQIIQVQGMQNMNGHSLYFTDPKQRINSIREQLNSFEEGKKKFEMVLKISRLSSMTPEQPIVQRKEQNIREIRQNMQYTSNALPIIKKYGIQEIGQEKMNNMQIYNRSRADEDKQNILAIDYRLNTKTQLQQYPTNSTQDSIVQEQKDKSFGIEQKLPRLQNNSNTRRVKNIFQQRQLSENKALDFYKFCASPLSNTNKYDFTSFNLPNQAIKRASNKL